MNKSLRNLCCVLAMGVLASGAAGATITESFESGFGPWRPNADTPLEWRITVSRDQAHDGIWSVDMTASGLADDGTLWIVREIQVPAGSWDIGLELYGWSPSDGMIGAISAIGFIGLYEPMNEGHFTQTPEGQDLGLLDKMGWKFFSMSRTIDVGTASTVYVALGYNITFEVFFTHYFDSVTITGVPVQCGNGECFGGEDACNCPEDCGPPPGSESACNDGKDEDCDGLTDCVDADCSGDPACAGVICDGDFVCEAGENQCDCAIDCDDPPLLESSCDNEFDDDCDGLKDCDDLMDCMFAPNCGGLPCDNDGVCESGENCTNCGDCFSAGGAVCGNGLCEAGDGEDCVSCAADCNGKQDGNPNRRFCCGDGDGQNPVSCTDSRCTSGGFACTHVPAATSCCGDGTCEGIEDGFNCEIDCGPPPACGDGTCDPGEDQCGCPSDCGAPPATETNCTDGIDNDCNQGTDCADPDCAGDPACQPSGCDGDGVCEPGEDCLNCAADCPGRTSGKPANRYCCGNGVLEGPEGDGSICDGNP